MINNKLSGLITSSILVPLHNTYTITHPSPFSTALPKLSPRRMAVRPSAALSIPLVMCILARMLEICSHGHQAAKVVERVQRRVELHASDIVVIDVDAVGRTRSPWPPPRR